MAEAFDASAQGETGRDVPGKDASRPLAAVPRSVRGLLWLGAFAGLVVAFSFAPAIQGLSLAADGERPPAASAAAAADALAAAQAQELAARP
jgi:hypothetical protein